MSKKQFALFFLPLAMGGSAIAQRSSSPKDSTGRQLDQVVVTATKYPVKQSLTGKVLTVITREDLEKAGGKQLTEILNTQAGLIVIGSQNTLGTQQDIYLQGAATGQTLILIDGIPAYDPSGTSNAFDLNLMNTDQIERIEILKGSQSTLYGSDAAAGVINIITKRGGVKPIDASVNLAGGSYGTFKGSAGVGGTVHNTSYNVQYTWLRTDGISAAYDSTGKGHFDNDGYNEHLVLANLTQKINRNLQLRGNLQYSHYNNDLDYGAYTDDTKFTGKSHNLIAGAGADYKLGLAMLHFNYNFNTVTRTYRDDSSMSVADGGNYSHGGFTGRSHYAELYTNIDLSRHIDLLAGLDYRNQRTDQTYISAYMNYMPPYQEIFDTSKIGVDSAKVRQFAAYASLLLKNFGGFNLGLGGRYNSFNKYGNVFTWSVNPSYVLNDRIKLFADFSSGFNAPTLYQLYSIYRNPYNNLDPQKTWTLQTGAQYSTRNINARALYFKRDTRNEIVFYTDASYNSYYINLGKQQDHGFELELSAKAGPLSFTGNYTYTTGKVITPVNGKDTTYYDLYRRPKNMANFTVGLQPLRPLYFSLSLRMVGERIEPVYGAVPLTIGSYYTLDGYIEYKLKKSIKLFADLKNFTNQRYFDIPGYNSLRFNFMAGIAVHL